MILDWCSTAIYKLNEEMGQNNFYVKRDDLLPASFGGNKARKAVLFFEELVKNGCNSVVTYGSNSSNHCRVIANIAASMRIRCDIISPIENKKDTYSNKMIRLFGASVNYSHTSEVSLTINNKLGELTQLGYRPYFIPGGGHGNIGTEAYVRAFKEIDDFQLSEKISFDYIFHASGTGTTQAGLVCGCLLNNSSCKIVGISIARKNPYGGNVVLESVNDYLLNTGRQCVTDEVVNFIDDYVLDGYGSYNQDVLGTIKEVLIKDGIPLDKIYTGKAFWGMKEYIMKNHIKGKNILFIHTGGTPLFFDGLEELNNE